MNRPVLILTIFNFVALAAGFLREAAIAYYFGTTSTADALAVTLLFIESVAAVAVSGLGSYVVVPIVNRIFTEESAGKAFALMQSLCLWLGLLSVPIAIAAILRPDLLVNVLGQEPTAANYQQLLSSLRLSIPSIPLLLASGVIGGVLQARADYFTPVLSRAFFSMAVATMVILGGGRFGVMAGSAGILVGAFVQLLVQLVILSRAGWRPSIPSFWHPSLSDALRFGLPALTAVVSTNLLMGNGQRFLAFGLPEGSLASISYAQRLLSLVTNVVLAISTVSLTELSTEYSKNPLDHVRTASVMQRAINSGLFLLTPLSILFFAYSYPITSAVYQRGKFGPASVALTADCVKWFSFAIIPALVLALALRAYSAFWRPWSNAWLSIFWSALTLIATALLLPRFQTIAVPAAYSLGTFAAAVVSIIGLRRFFERSFYTSLLQYATGIALCGGVSAAVLISLRGDPTKALDLTPDGIFRQGLAIAVFAGVFILMCFLCRDPHVWQIWSLEPVVRIRKQIQQWF
jgi:putative peptidoglycan lipid II flippase